MNNDSTIDIDLSNAFDEFRGMAEFINTFSKKLGDIIRDVVKPALEKIGQLLKEFLEKISKIIEDEIIFYTTSELHMPTNSCSLNKSNNLSQAPPIKDKSIKEIAIENFHYNIDRYNNSKIVSFIKCKTPSFAIELFKTILLSLILKLLGMQ